MPSNVIMDPMEPLINNDVFNVNEIAEIEGKVSDYY